MPLLSFNKEDSEDSKKMIDFTIKGQPPSKSNCYMPISKRSGNKTFASIAKKPSLKKYEVDFFSQVKGEFRGLLIDKPFKATLHCTFNSKRPDLDNSAKIILDCLQTAKVIKNDNLCYELLMTKTVDKDNAGVHIIIEVF